MVQAPEMQQRSAWVRQKKLKDRVLVALAVCSVVLVGALVVRNNADLVPLVGQQDRDSAAAGSLVDQSVVEEVPVAAPLREWVVLDGIEFVVAAANPVHARMSVAVWFQTPELREVILSRREGLRVVARRALTGLAPSEVRTPRVGLLLQAEFNRFLSTDMIVDVQIRECVIDGVVSQ